MSLARSAPSGPGNRKARRAARAGEREATAFQRALERHHAGDRTSAETLYRQILTRDPAQAMVWSNLAAILTDAGRFEEAIAACEEALAREPDHLNAMINLAGARQNTGDFAAATEIYTRLLTRHPQRFDIRMSLSHALERLGRFDDAIAVYDAMIAMDPRNVEALKSRAEILRKIGRDRDAIEAFADVVRVEPDEASALSNLGVLRAMYSRDNDLDAAAELCMKAALLAPTSAPIINNLGIVLGLRGDYDNALLLLRQLIAEHPTFAAAHSNLGSVLGTLCKYEDASAAFRQALTLDPTMREPKVELTKTRRYLCDWSSYADDRATIRSLADQAANFLIVLMASSTSAQEQLNYSITAMTRLNAATRPRRSAATDVGRRRLRVGYMSADYKNHPVGRLVPDLIARHDRTRFEVFGYSLGASDPVPLRLRLMRSFDHFIDLHRLSDADAAKRMEMDGIDILIDLTGPTAGGRIGILALRPAPIQISFLGLPGTSGAEAIDYIVADRTLIPPTLDRFYSERVVRLPHCYQPSDGERRLLSPLPSRSDCGLPEEGFVFCSFNSPVKITPEVFAVWLRLLHAVPGSLLWIYATLDATKANLRARAREFGIAEERIVFAGNIPYEMYLTRMTCADLFLDTHPYGAGATANDALWAGLPIVTCIGETYVSRMSASLLTTMGLEELIHDTIESYEACALRLARDPQALRALREKLSTAKAGSPLFDMARFTHDLEAAYIDMAERSARGEQPRSFDVLPAGQ